MPSTGSRARRTLLTWPKPFEMVEEMIFLDDYKGAMSAVLTCMNGQPSVKSYTSEKVLGSGTSR